MRFSFQAIDENGRVVRGVMRAEDEDDAREIMLGENVFPKTLEPAEEGTKVTWAPKKRIQRKLEQSRAGATAPKEKADRLVRALFNTIAVFGFDEGPVSGKGGLTEEGRFLFDAGGETRLAAGPDDVEIAQITGFPVRVLRITLISGKMYEFRAGVVFADAAARHVARTLYHPKKRKKNQ